MAGQIGLTESYPGLTAGSSAASLVGAMTERSVSGDGDVNGAAADLSWSLNQHGVPAGLLTSAASSLIGQLAGDGFAGQEVLLMDVQGGNASAAHTAGGTGTGAPHSALASVDLEALSAQLHSTSRQGEGEGEGEAWTQQQPPQHQQQSLHGIHPTALALAAAVAAARRAAASGGGDVAGLMVGASGTEGDDGAGLLAGAGLGVEMGGYEGMVRSAMSVGQVGEEGERG